MGRQILNIAFPAMALSATEARKVASDFLDSNRLCKKDCPDSTSCPKAFWLKLTVGELVAFLIFHSVQEKMADDNISLEFREEQGVITVTVFSKTVKYPEMIEEQSPEIVPLVMVTRATAAIFRPFKAISNEEQVSFSLSVPKGCVEIPVVPKVA